MYVFIYSYVLLNDDNATILILEVKERTPHTDDCFPYRKNNSYHIRHIDVVLHNQKCALLTLVGWTLRTGLKLSFHFYHPILSFTLGEFVTSLLHNPLSPPMLHPIPPPTKIQISAHLSSSLEIAFVLSMSSTNVISPIKSFLMLSF